MLIVEGPDGAGKTTLIRDLEGQLGWPVADRVVGTDTKPLLDLRKWVDENLERGWQDKIFDRHRLLSEAIYGPVLRGKARDMAWYDVDWMMNAYKQFALVEPIIIYCLPPLEVVKANIAADEANTVVKQFIDQIYRGYLAQYTMLAAADFTAVWRYDYTTTGAAEVLDWISEELDEDERD